MQFQWYNNGIRNKKIYEGDPIPEGFKKGYIIVMSKTKRLAKLNKNYEKYLKKVLKKEQERNEKRIKKLEQTLLQKQKEIYPDL